MSGEKPNPYAGRWVARLQGRVVGQGGTPEQARQAAKAARRKETPEIEYMQAEQTFPVPEIMQRIQPLIGEDERVYLVGGAVRDLLLGRPLRDFDFVLPKGGIAFARRVADKLGSNVYVLDKERDTGRVLLSEDEKRVTLDFNSFRGDTLEADLEGRDFTINAMALDLAQPEALLDPLGGAADLHAKKLKACSPTAFEDDPVRILRAIRMAATFGLKIEEYSKAGMRKAAQRLSEVSPERLRDEFFRLLLTPRPSTSLRALDILGALTPAFPELEAMKGCVQDEAHLYDVWEHTLKVIEGLEKTLGLLAEEYPEEGAGDLAGGMVVGSIGRYRKQISAHLCQEFVAERPLRGLLFFAALYHDSGKPPQKTVSNGKVRFPEHQLVGKRLAAERSRALHLSNDECARIENIVEHHSLPTILMKTVGVPDRRDIYRYFQTTGEAGIEICLHSLGDLMGKYGPELKSEALEARLFVVRALMEAYYEQYDEVVAPTPLVDGDTLIKELKLEPGPRLGEILAALREAQAAGELEDKKAALKLARKLAKE
jgi:poly(A) polymerase